MDRQPFLLRKLSQRLLGRREIDVGDDIKIANAIADEVLVDFPTTIRSEEILVDFPDKSNGNYVEDDEEDDDDDGEEGGFLGFPEGGRKPTVAQEWQTPNSHRKHSSQKMPLPTSIEIPIRNLSNRFCYSNEGTNTHNKSCNWVEAGDESDKKQRCVDCSYYQEFDDPVRPAQMLVEFSDRLETMNHDHADKHEVLSKVASCENPDAQTCCVEDNGTDSHNDNEAKLSVAINDSLDQFVRPSNWIDDEESDSDEDSETYRQRIVSMITAKAVGSQSPEPLSESPSGQHGGDSDQVVVQQIPPERTGARRCSRRSSMPANINCSVSLPSYGNSPFSKGFDFAKNISVPQREGRRPSMVNITYDFEKGLEAKPRYERSASLSKYASADSNLIGGLKAFGAKDHDIRRLLA